MIVRVTVQITILASVPETENKPDPKILQNRMAFAFIFSNASNTVRAYKIFWSLIANYAHVACTNSLLVYIKNQFYLDMNKQLARNKCKISKYHLGKIYLLRTSGGTEIKRKIDLKCQ